MFKFLKEKKKDNKGFTLVELVIVVAILAILVGILAPQYTKYVEKSRKSADASNLENMVRSMEIAAADASDTLKPDTYKITISNSKTEISEATNDNIKIANDVLKNAISADVLSTTLKSKDWDSDDNKISATIVITDDYTTTVSYAPAKLEQYVGKKSSTVNPTPTTQP